MNLEKQKRKYVKMIIIGFGTPIVLLIVSIMGFALANFLLSSSSAEGPSGIQLVLNTILLIVGVAAVTGFVWGPIIGILGIVKLSRLKNQNVASNSVSQLQSEPPEQSTPDKSDSDNLVSNK